MIILEYWISMISLAFFLPVMFLTWIKLKKLPSRVPLLFAVALTLGGSIYFGGAMASYLILARNDHVLASRIFSFFTSLSIIGLLLASLALIIPESKSDIDFTFQIVILTAIHIFTATYNALTMRIVIVNNMLRIYYDHIGLLGLMLTFSTLTVISIKRIKKIRSILTLETPEPFKTLPFQVFFSLTIFIQFFTISLTRAIPRLSLPAFTWFLPSLLTVFFIGWSIQQHPSYLFVTDHRLEAIFFIQKQSGLVIYSETRLKKAKTIEDILSSILKGLDFSLRRFFDAETSLEKIIFGDKVLLFEEGKFIITLMVLSHDGVIARDICKFLTQRFEATFNESLINDSPPEMTNYTSFTAITKEARAFFVP